MKSANGFYSIVQIGSGAGRAEFLNFAVFLSCPILGYSGLKILNPSSQRIDKFWSDRVALHEFLVSAVSELNHISDTLRSVEDKHEAQELFSAISNENLRILPPQWILLEMAPARVLMELFRDFVEVNAIQRNSFRRLPELDYHFRSEKAKNTFNYDQMIEIPNYKHMLAHYRFSSEAEDGMIVGRRLLGSMGDILEEVQKYALRAHFLRKANENGRQRQLTLIPVLPYNANNRLESEIMELTRGGALRIVRSNDVEQFVQNIQMTAMPTRASFAS